MGLTSLVIAAGVFSLGLGAWHIGVPRWFAFRAAIPDRGPDGQPRTLPPFRLGPVRHATTPADVLGIAWVMNALASYVLISMGLVCRCQPAPRPGCSRVRGPVSGDGSGRFRAGSLEEFLTDRPSLFAVRGGRLWRGDVEHGPWPLTGAEATFGRTGITESLGLVLPDVPPHLMACARIETIARRPVVVPAQRPGVGQAS